MSTESSVKLNVELAGQTPEVVYVMVYVTSPVLASKSMKPVFGSMFKPAGVALNVPFGVPVMVGSGSVVSIQYCGFG